MVSLAVIHQLQQSQVFQLDMLRLKREQEAEERKQEQVIYSCPGCGGRTKRAKGLCGRCLDFVA